MLKNLKLIMSAADFAGLPMPMGTSQPFTSGISIPDAVTSSGRQMVDTGAVVGRATGRAPRKTNGEIIQNLNANLRASARSKWGFVVKTSAGTTRSLTPKERCMLTGTEDGRNFIKNFINRAGPLVESNIKALRGPRGCKNVVIDNSSTKLLSVSNLSTSGGKKKRKSRKRRGRKGGKGTRCRRVSKPKGAFKKCRKGDRRFKV